MDFPANAGVAKMRSPDGSGPGTFLVIIGPLCNTLVKKSLSFIHVYVSCFFCKKALDYKLIPKHNYNIITKTKTAFSQTKMHVRVRTTFVKKSTIGTLEAAPKPSLHSDVQSSPQTQGKPALFSSENVSEIYHSPVECLTCPHSYGSVEGCYYN